MPGVEGSNGESGLPLTGGPGGFLGPLKSRGGRV